MLFQDFVLFDDKHLMAAEYDTEGMALGDWYTTDSDIILLVKKELVNLYTISGNYRSMFSENDIIEKKILDGLNI